MTASTSAARPEPWSVNDILAHVRASADMREKYIANMASGDRATLRYESPRGWIRKTNHLGLPFAESFAAYRAHRSAWLAQLETMSLADWERGALIRDRPETIASYVRNLTDHETVHCEQIEALLRSTAALQPGEPAHYGNGDEE